MIHLVAALVSVHLVLCQIDLLGYNRDNEMVLVDSVRYKFNSVNIDANTDKDSITIDQKLEAVNIRQDEENSLDKNELNSISNEEANDDSTLKIARFEDRNNSNTLGTWAIVLITLGFVTVTALIVVCAYYIGMFRAKPKVIPVIYDVEPPVVDILPRVRGTVKPFNYNF